MENTEQKDESNETQAQPETVSTQSQEDATVPKTAYENTRNDMHKYKAQSRERQAKINELETRLEADAKAQLEEQEKYKELWEQEKTQKVELQSRVEASEKLARDNAKKRALREKLGDVKDEYLVFANLDSIDINDDGSIDPDSLHNAANSFRQAHPGLITKPTGSGITDQAPSPGVDPNGPVDVSKLSKEQRMELFRQQFNK